MVSGHPKFNILQYTHIYYMYYKLNVLPNVFS